jgi:ATP-dependent DNA helicase RecG
MKRQRIFISSVQKELAEERQALKNYIEGDALLSRFFDVFLFESLPAADRHADEVYLDEVGRCDLYIGLFGNKYGHPNTTGLSPTEREFDRATAAGKTRLIYVKGMKDSRRDPKMAALLGKAGDQLIRRRFADIDELKSAIYASLVDELAARGVVSDKPFDERSCDGASLADLDAGAVASFVHLARAKRDFPLAEDTSAHDVLTHLGLLRDGTPVNAAMLLFGRTPQRFIPCAEVRCMHFHGTEIARPAPFYRIFKGTLLAQVESAANFVLSVTNLSVGTRALGPQAPVTPELPPDVVREAVVNAIAHRDYTGGAAVQVAVFADRVEIWNPGELLPPLTPESLRVPHRSVARNHRICEALFLAGYIEKYGTGTLMMIRESVEHDLPEPMFKQSGGEFVATIGRDWLTEELLAGLNLNDRQFRAVMHVKLHGQITNSAYRGLVGISESTALRDLKSLVGMGLLEITEGTGRTARYELARGKPVINPSNPSSPPRVAIRHNPVKPVAKGKRNGSQMARRPGPSTGHDFAEVGRSRKQAECKSLRLKARESESETGQVAMPVAGETGTKSGPGRDQVGILRKCREESAISALMTVMGRSNRTKFRDKVLKPLLSDGLIEMTIPNKPTSRLQKYRLTDKGRAWLGKARP